MFIIICPMQSVALDRYEITWVFVCLCRCVCICLSELTFLFDHDSDHTFSLFFWNFEFKSRANEDQVRWSVKREEAVSAHESRINAVNILCKIFYFVHLLHIYRYYWALSPVEIFSNLLFEVIQMRYSFDFDAILRK